MSKKAVVIIPTYNERENIAKIVPALLRVFEKISDWQMSILVVDDTSPDKTYEVVEELCKLHSEVHLVMNEEKSGLGGAYLKGMKHSFSKLDADVIFEFDADFSHDPEKIPAFLDALDEGYDMVLGSRYITGGGIPGNWGLHRKFLSVVGNMIIATVLTNFSIRDWTTGYRAIRKKVYEVVSPNINSERFMGYTFQIGFLNNAVRNGFKIKEVPFVFVDRSIGESKLGTEYIKNTLLYIFKVRYQDVITNRFFKFLTVGGFGTFVQISALVLLKTVFGTASSLRLQIVNLIAIECAIFSNFILNNLWTFADKKLQLREFPKKFLHFNVASAGSVLIQTIIMALGLTFIGAKILFSVPVLNFEIDTPVVFSVVGILVGLFWNFFAYSKFVWKKSKCS